MITRDGRELWNIAAPAGCEMQTTRILPDGNALVAWCGHPSTILEVNMKGEVLSKTEFETGIERPHAQVRQINKSKKGNYLVPLFATSEVREIAPNGQLLNKALRYSFFLCFSGQRRLSGCLWRRSLFRATES